MMNNDTLKYSFSTYLAWKAAISKELDAALQDMSIYRHQKLKKGTSLLMPRMLVDEMHYLVKGMCKAFWLDEYNEEQIFQIWPEDRLVILWDDFYAETRNTMAYLVLLQDSEILTMTRKQHDLICAQHPDMLRAMYCTRKDQMEERDEQLRIMMQKEGERYALFVKLFPDRWSSLTEKDTCAFLGISKTTLAASKREMLREDLKKRR